MSKISNMSATFNNSGIANTAIGMNVYNAASANNSNLIDLKVNSVSKFRVDLDGNITANSFVQTIVEPWGAALSDESSALVAGNNKFSFSIPYNTRVVGVYGFLSNASTDNVVTFDINKNGVSILGTKIIIDTNKTSAGSLGYAGVSANVATISDNNIPAFSNISFDMDTVGTNAKGSKIVMLVYRTN